jgi:hypothetical protein|tara:strand:- start:168 stop:1061 length:894 start_codon:yes stop_codon:yes gene_type:complete
MFIKNIYNKIFKTKTDYKLQKKINLFKENYEKIIFENNKVFDTKSEINFLHSGTSGDLIYALAVLNKISLTHKCNFYVNVNKKFTYEYYKHNGEGFLISERMFDLLLPLLKKQKFLNIVKRHENEKIDIDLDLFRELPWNNTFNSPRWYFHIAGEQEDLSLPYMFVDEHPTINNRIVIQRTFRFRNIYINYEFIKNYESALFIGIKEEYDDLKKQIPNLEFYEPKDFLEIAQIIKSSKFFLGNQSVCYPIAEALKVPRLLEASPDYPVVQPIGKDAFDFYFQPHFEKWFNHLYKKTK